MTLAVKSVIQIIKQQYEEIVHNISLFVESVLKDIFLSK